MKMVQMAPRYRLQEVDHLRRRRYKAIAYSYWAATIFIGVVLLQYEELTQRLAAMVAENFNLPGLTSIAQQSFQPDFTASFMAAALSVAVLLAIAGMFVVPRGSEQEFRNYRSKIIGIFLGVGMFLACLGIFVISHRVTGDGNRSSALLLAGASSFVGVVTIINVFFGFAQLFFFLGLRGMIFTPVVRV